MRGGSCVGFTLNLKSRKNHNNKLKNRLSAKTGASRVFSVSPHKEVVAFCQREKSKLTFRTTPCMMAPEMLVCEHKRPQKSHNYVNKNKNASSI